MYYEPRRQRTPPTTFTNENVCGVVESDDDKRGGDDEDAASGSVDRVHAMQDQPYDPATDPENIAFAERVGTVAEEEAAQGEKEAISGAERRKKVREMLLKEKERREKEREDYRLFGVMDGQKVDDEVLFGSSESDADDDDEEEAEVRARDATAAAADSGIAGMGSPEADSKDRFGAEGNGEMRAERHVGWKLPDVDDGDDGEWGSKRQKAGPVRKGMRARKTKFRV